MDAKSEMLEFLTCRRAKITPEQAGLTVYGDNWRVPGLRREEAAMLAGVSADYYTQVERGNVNGVSDSVLEALVRALQLDDAERAYLFNLTRVLGTANQSRPPKRRVRASVQQGLDAMTGAPAYVRNEYGDLCQERASGVLVADECILPKRSRGPIAAPDVGLMHCDERISADERSRRLGSAQGLSDV